MSSKYTNIESFVSLYVREKCKSTKITLNDSSNDIDIRQSLKSLRNIPPDIGASKSYLLQSTESITRVEDLYEVEESKVICAVFEITNYAILIRDLSLLGTVSPQIITRSLEVYLSKIIDIISENGGDIVTVLCDKIVAVWRIKEYEDFYPISQTSIDMIASLVVLCCITCSNVIREAEIWALEDISEKYSNFKFNLKCGISDLAGKDQIVGVPGFILNHLFYGKALYECENILNMDGFDQGIIITDQIYQMTKDSLLKYKINVNFFGGSHLISSTPHIASNVLSSIFNEVSKFINFAQSNTKSEYISYLLNVHMADGASLLVKELKSSESKKSLFFSGSWVQCTFICASVHIPIYQNGTNFQNCFQIFIQSVRKYGVHMHRVKVGSDENIFFTAVVNEKMFVNHYQVAVRMAIHTFERFHKVAKNITFGLSSGYAFEGLIKGVHRNLYRLVSYAEIEAESLVVHQDNFGIFVNEHVYQGCKNSPIIGLFNKSVKHDDIYHVTKLSSDFKKSKSFTKSAIDHIEKIKKMTNSFLSGNSKNLLIEGPQGKGEENEVFKHPLSPYVSIVRGLFDIIDELDFSPPVLMEEKSTVRQVKFPVIISMDTFNSNLNASGEEIGRTSDVRQFANRIVAEARGGREYKKSGFQVLKDKFHRNSRVHPSLALDKDFTRRKSVVLEKKRIPSTFSSKNSEILLKIKRNLVKLNEDLVATLPLFNILLSDFIPETSITEKIGPDGRTLLLSELLVKMINKIAEYRPLAIVIDDTHWMDSASWAVTLHIVRRCKRAFVILAARPCFDWRLKILTSVGSLATTDSIILRDGTTSEVEAQILLKFSGWISFVDKKLVQTLKDISEGRQTQITILISYLKDSELVQVVNGTLIPKGGIEDFKSALPNQLDDFLLSVFDKLRSAEFKNLLKIASVIGREFSLEEVATVLSGEYAKFSLVYLERLKSLIKIDDYARFLEPVEGDKQSPICPFENNFIFSSSQMREAIYNNRISIAEKNSIHLKLVRYYEKEIVQDNEPTFVPKICHHYHFIGYTDRDDILQHVKYMVMLGNYICLSAEMYLETIQLYTEIKSLIEEKELEDVLGANLRSEIHIRLGHAYSHGLPDEINKIQSLRHLMIATDMLDFKWPRTNSQWWHLIIKEASLWGWSTFAKIFLKKDNSSKQKKKRRNFLWYLFNRDEYYANQKIDRLEHLQPVLKDLSRNLIENDSRMRDQICCDLLVLNNAYRMGIYHSSGTKLSISFATNFWFSGHPVISKNIASRILEKNMDALSYSAGSFYWIVCGRWDIALRWAIKGMELSQKVGDFNNWQMCSQQESFLNLFNGHFYEVMSIEKKRGGVCSMYGHTLGIRTASIMIITVQVLQGNFDDAKSTRDEKNHWYRELPPVLRAQLQAIFAHIEISNENFNLSLDCIERAIELFVKIHPTNIQVFSTIFLLTLALYSIYEKSKAKKTKSQMTGPLISKSLTVGKPPSSNSPSFSEYSDGAHSDSDRENVTDKSLAPLNVARQNGAVVRRTINKKVNYVVKVVRGEDGSIEFNYNMKNKPSGVKKSQFEVITTQIKKLSYQLANAITAFKGHVLAEPFLILLNALAKLCDTTVVHSNLARTYGPQALRIWVQKKISYNTGEMKLIVALAAIKCWTASDENLEYTTDLNLGMAMLAELGLDGLYSF